MSTVIDATGSPAQPDMTVVVANQRIAAIGPSKTTEIPRDAENFRRYRQISNPRSRRHAHSSHRGW